MGSVTRMEFKCFYSVFIIFTAFVYVFASYVIIDLKVLLIKFSLIKLSKFYIPRKNIDI